MRENDLRNKQGLTEEEFLAAYDVTGFERPSVTVDMVIFTVTNQDEENYRKLPEKVLRVLMVKRGDHPFMGQWALPGGFIAMDESIDKSAVRLLKDETNVENIYMEQLYTWGDIDRDPRTRVISCSYMTLVDSYILDIKPGYGADDAKWFTVTSEVFQEQKDIKDKGYVLQSLIRIELTNDEEKLSAVLRKTKTVEGKVTTVKWKAIESSGIAFDHSRIIQYGIERLRNKIEYTDIAFNLMPELFTLTELQQVYEVILDKELLKANFRRKIADMVIETNQFTKDAGHRPSKLYRFNPDWENGTYL